MLPTEWGLSLFFSLVKMTNLPLFNRQVHVTRRVVEWRISSGPECSFAVGEADLSAPEPQSTGHEGGASPSEPTSRGSRKSQHEVASQKNLTCLISNKALAHTWGIIFPHLFHGHVSASLLRASGE